MTDSSELITVREFPDRGTQWLLDTADNVRAVMRILSPALAEQMDFSRLQRVPTRFIPDDLRKQMADLLFRVPFRMAGTEWEVLIILLIEHQSTPDPEIGFRLLCYLVHFWEQEKREWESSHSGTLQLTPAVASVFYTGAESWRRLPTLADLMDLPEALREFVPDPHALFLNLKARPPEELTAWGDPLGWVLRVLRKEHASEEEIAAALREATEQLATLPDTEEAAWRRLMWFLMLLIYHRRAPSEHKPLSNIVTGAARERQREEEIVNMSNTIAEELIREGEARGALHTKQEYVLQTLATRFADVPAEVARQIQAIADLSRLDTLFRRALTVERLEDFVVA